MPSSTRVRIVSVLLGSGYNPPSNETSSVQEVPIVAKMVAVNRLLSKNFLITYT